MPYCKNNSKKTFIGDEPSPKGLGYCASGEKEGTKMKGKDGNIWIKSDNKWIKYNNTDYNKIIFNKLYKWWLMLSQGGIIVIYQNNTHKLIKSSKSKKEIIKKWNEYDKDKEIKAIIWSAISIDVIQQFVEYLIKKSTKTQLDKFIKMKKLPDYLLKNYKKYFKKDKFISSKDYYFKQRLLF
jgi:hypothetical protein